MIPNNFFLEIGDEGHFLIHFMKGVLTRYQIQKKITTKNYRPTALTNTDAKSLTKYWQIEFSNTYKKIIHRDQGGLLGSFDIQKSINVIYDINRPQEKNRMSLSINS